MSEHKQKENSQSLFKGTPPESSPGQIPQQLAQLVGLTVHGKTKAAFKACMRACDLITELLANSDELSLQQTSQLLLESKGPQEVEFLNHLIRDQAQDRHYPNDTQVQLIALPIYLLGSGSPQAELQDPSALTELAQLFTATKLVEPGVLVSFIPRIFAASELLGLSWAGVSKLIDGQLPPQPAAAAARQPHAQPGYKGLTRFLVGTVTGLVDTLTPFVDQVKKSYTVRADPHSSTPHFLDTWITPANTLVARALGVPSTSIFIDAPAAYFAALAYGIPASGILALRSASRQLAKQGSSKAELQAVVSYHDMSSGAREVRVVVETAANSQPQLATTIYLPPVATGDDNIARSEVFDALENTVGRLKTIKPPEGRNSFKDELCRCGAARFFLSNNTQFCPSCSQQSPVTVPESPTKH